jgi:hypothetical protein
MDVLREKDVFDVAQSGVRFECEQLKRITATGIVAWQACPQLLIRNLSRPPEGGRGFCVSGRDCSN